MPIRLFATLLLLSALGGCATNGAAGLQDTDEFLRRALDAYDIGRPPTDVRIDPPDQTA